MAAHAAGPSDPKVIGRGMAKGAAWMVAMRLVVRGAGLINMVILARLLVPEDFGLVAMAMIFVGAIEVFSEFNFDVALIKKQSADRTDYDTAWTLSIIRGGVTAAVLLAIAAPAADLFDEPRLAMVIAVLSLSSVLLGFQNIGVVDFRKSLDFRRDFLFMASGKVVAVIITIGLALIWQNYWALVGGMIGGKIWRVAAKLRHACLQAAPVAQALAGTLCLYQVADRSQHPSLSPQSRRSSRDQQDAGCGHARRLHARL